MKMLQMFVQKSVVGFIHISLGRDKLERENQNIRIQTQDSEGPKGKDNGLLMFKVAPVANLCTQG